MSDQPAKSPNGRTILRHSRLPELLARAMSLAKEAERATEEEQSAYLERMRAILAEIESTKAMEAVLNEFSGTLEARQASIMPDLEALYKRKAELDQEPHDPR
jgi:hypothetical protein